MLPFPLQDQIQQAIEQNAKLDGRKTKAAQLALFITSGPVVKVPRRSMNKRLPRHLFLVSFVIVFNQLYEVSTRVLVSFQTTSFLQILLVQRVDIT